MRIDLFFLVIAILGLGIYYYPKIQNFVYQRTGRMLDKDKYQKYLISSCVVALLILLIPVAKNTKRNIPQKKQEKPAMVNIDSIQKAEKKYLEDYIKKENEKHIDRLKTIIELKDKVYCTHHSDVIRFLDLIEKTSETLKVGPESELLEPAKKALRAFQVKNFPIARKLYFQNAKAVFWENDIEVYMNGRNIKYVSFRYALNADKKAGYYSVHNELMRLRFKSVTFASTEGVDDTRWNLDSKKDSDIY